MHEIFSVLPFAFSIFYISERAKEISVNRFKMARLPSSQMSVSEQRFLWATLSRLLLKTLVGSGDYFLVCLLGFVVVVVVDGIFFTYYNSNRFGRIFLFQSSSLSLNKCHRMSVKNLSVNRVVGQLRVSFFVHASDLENKCRMLKIATDVVFLCQIHWKLPVCKDRLFKWEQQKISGYEVQLECAPESLMSMADA